MKPKHTQNIPLPPPLQSVLKASPANYKLTINQTNAGDVHGALDLIDDMSRFIATLHDLKGARAVRQIQEGMRGARRQCEGVARDNFARSVEMAGVGEGMVGAVSSSLLPTPSFCLSLLLKSHRRDGRNTHT